MLTRLQYAQVNRAVQPNEVKYIRQAMTTIPAIIKSDLTSNTKQQSQLQTYSTDISTVAHTYAWDAQLTSREIWPQYFPPASARTILDCPLSRVFVLHMLSSSKILN